MKGKRLKSPKQRADVVSIVTGIMLFVYVIGLLAPMLWTVLTSLLSVDQYRKFFVFEEYKNAKLFSGISLDNFATSFKKLVVQSNSGMWFGVTDMYINSLQFSLFSALAFTFCSTLVAYLVARFDFKFSKIVYAFVIVAMSLPIVGSMPSELQMLHNIKIGEKELFGTWLSIPVLRFNFLSVYFLVLYATFRGISKEYSEAAKIDGASNLRIMTRIIMPQAMNIIVTIFVLTFINYWNDYLIPQLYLPDYPVAALGMFRFINDNSISDIPLKMAGTLIMALPILLVVIIFNKRLRVSVSIGGIKG